MYKIKPPRYSAAAIFLSGPTIFKFQAQGSISYRFIRTDFSVSGSVPNTSGFSDDGLNWFFWTLDQIGFWDVGSDWFFRTMDHFGFQGRWIQLVFQDDGSVGFSGRWITFGFQDNGRCFFGYGLKDGSWVFKGYDQDLNLVF